MTVEINFENSNIRGDGKIVELNLEDTDKDNNYASWMGYAESYEGPKIDTHWTWENPDEPLENVTLSPSLILKQDDPNTFHIFIKNGEIEHCGDCQCGCIND